jgi:2-polyprenyl-3-methyl-5-hydroxy-6-metoxy-1,4-benzoquinol methylase
VSPRDQRLWFGTAILLVTGSLAACRATPARAQSAPSEHDRTQLQDKYRRPDLVVAALHIAPGAVVADVGAGAGYLTHRLAAAAGPSGRVVATDIDASALERIGSSGPGEAPIVTRTVVPVDPALERGAYDLILLSEVDHLLVDREAYLRQLVAALKPGSGRIAISNRRVHRAPVLAAAERAGLSPKSEFEGLPAHFLIEVAP